MKGKFYVVLVWVLSLSFLVFVSGCSVQETQKDTNIIKLAALLPLSGELGSKGEIRKLAIEMGVEDTNKNWEEEGLDRQFEITIEDSQSDPEVALSKAKKLWKEGHEIFIVGSSAEIEGIQPWASKKGAIVISYSSTSPALRIEGDSVFRMVPDDTEQAKALADLLEYEGIYGIVSVYRNDIYGSELTKHFTEEFESLHGTVTFVRNLSIFDDNFSTLGLDFLTFLITFRLSTSIFQLSIILDSGFPKLLLYFLLNLISPPHLPIFPSIIMK